MSLYIRSSFINPFSVDGVAFDLIKLLKDKNIPFKLSDKCFVEDINLNDIYKYPHGVRLPSDFQLVINPACFLHNFNIDNKTIIYTLWDSSIVPLEYVNEINKARLVIVPSNSNKEAFINSGVIRPIEVIPLGFDSWIYKPETFNCDSTRRNPYSDCIFGASGQVTTSTNDRKDLDKVIKAFKLAFPINQNESVNLELKLTPNSDLSSLTEDPRVKISNALLSKEDMAKWYRNLTSYINVSKYEAFGLQPMEAMACGIPVITPKHSGVGDYFDNDMGYVIGHERIDANTNLYNQGNWYRSNIDELVSTMRYVYNNKFDAFNKGLMAHKKIQKMDKKYWDGKIIDLVRRFAF